MGYSLPADMKNLLLVLIMSLSACSANEHTKPVENSQAAIVNLGEQLFFDVGLSQPVGQSCSSCHSPAHGFADPDQTIAVSEGANPDRFTSRNSPTLSYAMYSPPLHYDQKEDLYIGGYFHDGHANTLETQVVGPMLGVVEMGNPDKASVVNKLKNGPNTQRFRRVFGPEAFDDSEQAFAYLTSALAAFERSEVFRRFDSKYDLYLAGKVMLSDQEQRGLKVFEQEDKGNCAACHPNQPSEDGAPPLFTDFTYDNLGTPSNPDSPFLTQALEFNPDGKQFVDQGLANTIKQPEQAGKFRVSTLRNIELTAPYMHNGVFKTLKEVVEFYNTRDVDSRWDKPEVSQNVNKDEIGDLKLNDQEIEDLVVFLKTLTDGYQAVATR